MINGSEFVLMVETTAPRLGGPVYAAAVQMLGSVLSDELLLRLVGVPWSFWTCAGHGKFQFGALRLQGTALWHLPRNPATRPWAGEHAWDNLLVPVTTLGILLAIFQADAAWEIEGEGHPLLVSAWRAVGGLEAQEWDVVLCEARGDI